MLLWAGPNHAHDRRRHRNRNRWGYLVTAQAHATPSHRKCSYFSPDFLFWIQTLLTQQDAYGTIEFQGGAHPTKAQVPTTEFLSSMFHWIDSRKFLFSTCDSATTPDPNSLSNFSPKNGIWSCRSCCWQCKVAKRTLSSSRNWKRYLMALYDCLWTVLPFLL